MGTQTALYAELSKDAALCEWKLLSDEKYSSVPHFSLSFFFAFVLRNTLGFWKLAGIFLLEYRNILRHSFIK